MEPDFWRARWENNQIAFHEGKPNAFLVKHFARLPVAAGTRVFVPLCGKTRDIFWLLSEGFQVAGAELSPIAIGHLFEDLGITPTVSAEGALTRYAGPSIDIFVGDIFALSRAQLGPVDAVYDRAALVALPPDLRGRYAAHLMDIADTAPQLLISFEYDQSQLAGPPFSVPPQEVRAHYGAHYLVSELEHADVPGGLKGQCAANEHVFLLDRG